MLCRDVRRIYLKKLSLLLLALITLVALPSGVSAQGDAFLVEQGKGEAWFSLNWGSTRNYFNTEGETRLFDSLRTTFTAYTLGISANYGILGNLEANLELPIASYNLSSESRFPDRSIFSPAWYGIGLTYGQGFGQLRLALSSIVRIPPGFHDGIYDDPQHPSFLSDGYFQFLNMLHLGYSGEEFWLKGSIGYNMRGEEPVDEIVYGGQVGFSRVKGTGIYVGFGGVVATEDPSQPFRPFYAGANLTDTLLQNGGTGHFATIDRENYFFLQPGAFIEVNDRLTLSAQYQVRLFGLNSLRLNTISGAAGLRF